jgi:hypothetical protein
MSSCTHRFREVTDRDRALITVPIRGLPTSAMQAHFKPASTCAGLSSGGILVFVLVDPAFRAEADLGAFALALVVVAPPTELADQAHRFLLCLPLRAERPRPFLPRFLPFLPLPLPALIRAISIMGSIPPMPPPPGGPPGGAAPPASADGGGAPPILGGIGIPISASSLYESDAALVCSPFGWLNSRSPRPETWTSRLGLGLRR